MSYFSQEEITRNMLIAEGRQETIELLDQKDETITELLEALEFIAGPLCMEEDTENIEIVACEAIAKTRGHG